MFKITSLSVLFSCFACFVYAQRITGLVLHQGRNEPMAQVAITFLSETGKQYRAGTDDEGKFHIKKIRKGSYSVKISGFSIADTILTGILISGDSSLTIKYSVYCKYDKSAKDNKCPRCEKDDAVIPIHYGLLSVRVPKEGHQDNAAQRQKEPEYFPGGCFVTNCDPNWYCKRDSLEF